MKHKTAVPNNQKKTVHLIRDSTTAAIYRRNGGTVPQNPRDQVGAATGLGRNIDPLIAIESDITVSF